MFSASTELYDLIYLAFKDYAGEAAQIASRLRQLHPRCQTVLDVACGTGEHARHLAALDFSVDGLDLNPAFVRIAQGKHLAGRFFVGDMCDFRLPHRYDAILCLFSSIGYLQTLDRVGMAIRRFREHLAPGGVIIVEPWFAPGVLDPALATRKEGDANGVHVVRVSRREIEGRISRLYFDYEIAEPTGIRREHEVHVLGLFSQAEMLGAFQNAGLQAEHEPKGLTDRGLYVATAKD